MKHAERYIQHCYFCGSVCALQGVCQHTCCMMEKPFLIPGRVSKALAAVRSMPAFRLVGGCRKPAKLESQAASVHNAPCISSELSLW